MAVITKYAPCAQQQAEIMELSAAVEGPAVATVLEARTERGLGPVATVVVKSGTLKVGRGQTVRTCGMCPAWCARDVNPFLMLKNCASPSVCPASYEVML